MATLVSYDANSMRLAPLLFTLWLGVSVAFQANPAPIIVDAATISHDHESHDFDHTEVSETEYSHRHSPSEPVHHHHHHQSESGSATVYSALPVQHETVSVVLCLLDELVPFPVESFDSLSYHPPDRPPRA